MLNILIIVVIVGVPAFLICKMLLKARSGVAQCPCGGNVTATAGHGPCGCTLANQQDDSGLTDSLTCPGCGNKMLPTGGEGLSYHCSSDNCTRVVTLR